MFDSPPSGTGGWLTSARSPSSNFVTHQLLPVRPWNSGRPAFIKSLRTFYPILMRAAIASGSDVEIFETRPGRQPDFERAGATRAAREEDGARRLLVRRALVGRLLDRGHPARAARRRVVGDRLPDAHRRRHHVALSDTHALLPADHPR